MSGAIGQLGQLGNQAEMNQLGQAINTGADPGLRYTGAYGSGLRYLAPGLIPPRVHGPGADLLAYQALNQQRRQQVKSVVPPLLPQVTPPAAASPVADAGAANVPSRLVFLDEGGQSMWV